MSVVDVLGLEDVELLVHGDKGSIKRVKAKDELKGKTVALYFSAHWCGPCRNFTPRLTDVYHSVKQKHPEFQLMFVSSDTSKAHAEEYFKVMPWLAVPFEEHEVRSRLSSRFGVTGIPRLVIVGPDGETVASDARVAVQNDPTGEQYPWAGTSTSGQALLGSFTSPRGLLLLFIIGYWLAQWLGLIKK